MPVDDSIFTHMWRTVVGHNLKTKDFKVGRSVLESPEEQEKEGKSRHDQDSCLP